MTLNENTIRELLDASTPGPWKLDPETDGIKNSAGNSVVRGDAYCDGDEVWLEWRFDADPALAALAPELAQDWLRMRNDLSHLARVLEDFAASQDATPADKFAAQQIHKLLNGVTND